MPASTTDTRTVPRLEHKVEAELCKREFWRFAQYVRIPDPPPAGAGQVAFQAWPHLVRLHQVVEGVRPGGVLPVLKARKVGATSYFEARDMWKTYLPGAFLPVLSQGEREAKKVIADCLFIWEHLPEHLQVPLVRGNLESLVFKNGAQIEAFPSTKKAGRSYTGTEILMDEADLHELFEASYHALLPLIQDTGGKMFLVSTPNPDLVDSMFRQIYREADNKLYLGYFDRPGRTEETYEAARSLSKDDARFEKENSRNETEALAPPRARAFFDVDAVSYMQVNEVGDPREQNDLVSIWKPVAVGRKYLLGGDTSWGRTGSYNALSVHDWQTMEQVAELHGRLQPATMAAEVVALHKKYNHAYMGLERAGVGQERDGESVVVVDKVVELLKQCECQGWRHTGRLYYHDHASKEPSVPGWQTTELTRDVMLNDLREAVREGQVVIHSRGGVAEMMNFVRTEKGRPEASRGAYDDRVISYALAWQMKGWATFSTAGASKAAVRARR